VSTRIPGRARIEGSFLESSPAGAERIVMPRAGHFRQDGRTVQMFAIRKTAESFERLRASQAQSDRTLHFVGHQANLRMLESVCRECRIPPEHHHSNVEWFGNTAAAGSPSVVSMSWERWGATDDVALVGVGSGLTWSGCVLRFGEMP
jgi:3-oxoacyl-[acyl-carrier-protein] synthase-3